MTPEREAAYDKEIAPELLRIARRCEELGLSFVAQVAWGDQEGGSTVKLTDELWPASRIAAYAARANGNADHLIKWLLADAEKHGNGSMYLALLKYKMTPSAHAADIN